MLEPEIDLRADVVEISLFGAPAVNVGVLFFVYGIDISCRAYSEQNAAVRGFYGAVKSCDKL